MGCPLHLPALLRAGAGRPGACGQVASRAAPKAGVVLATKAPLVARGFCEALGGESPSSKQGTAAVCRHAGWLTRGCSGPASAPVESAAW
jgi:hypothetical protein